MYVGVVIWEYVHVGSVEVWEYTSEVRQGEKGREGGGSRKVCKMRSV